MSRGVEGTSWCRHSYRGVRGEGERGRCDATVKRWRKCGSRKRVKMKVISIEVVAK